MEPRVGVVDLGGLDEDRVELAGEERLGQLPEEGLEQARHHVHVLPPSLFLQPERESTYFAISVFSSGRATKFI